MNRLSVLLLLVIVGLQAQVGTAHAQLLSPRVATADVSASLLASYDDDLLVRIDNAGPNRVDAVIDVALPDAVTAIRLPAGCEISATGLRCRSQGMYPDSYTVFPVDIVQTDRAAQVLTAVVSGDLEDPATSNDRAQLVVSRMAAPGAADDVISTAIAVSQLRFGQDSTPARVVLARVDSFADALAGTPLTGEAPLLYTATDALDPRTAHEIDRLMPTGGEVVVLGGGAAVADDVLADLTARGHQTTRIAGASRIGTALAIADHVIGSGDRVLVARADGEGTAAWADSVAAGGYAAMSGTPVLLTPGAALPAEVSAWLASRGVRQTVVIGGSAAISEDVAARLPGAQRVSGPDRAATAVAISGLYPSTRSQDADRRFHIVNGFVEDGWAYGLVAAGLAAEEGAPVLFADTTSTPDATVGALTSCRERPVALAVVGGASQVSPATYTDLDGLDAQDC